MFMFPKLQIFNISNFTMFTCFIKYVQKIWFSFSQSTTSKLFKTSRTPIFFFFTKFTNCPLLSTIQIVLKVPKIISIIEKVYKISQCVFSKLHNVKSYKTNVCVHIFIVFNILKNFTFSNLQKMKPLPTNQFRCYNNSKVT